MAKDRIEGWDRHLACRAVAGDDTAFALLMEHHRPTLTRQAMRLLRNVDDAYDAVQDATLKAHRGIRDFDPSRPLRPWLARILANVCVDLVRDRRRRAEQLEDHDNLPDLNADDPDVGLRQGQVRAALAKLPEQYRRILHMRHYRQMEVMEIAEELQAPEGTVKSLLFRARARLRQQLGPQFG